MSVMSNDLRLLVLADPEDRKSDVPSDRSVPKTSIRQALKRIPVMATDLTVANTILSQMGGTGRLSMMIGAHTYTGSVNSVTFKFKARAKNGSNCLRVTLDPSDTYTVEFLSLRSMNVKVKETLSDIYAEDLRRIFQEKTGLYLSL
jgi:hypothetical protein